MLGVTPGALHLARFDCSHIARSIFSQPPGVRGFTPFSPMGYVIGRAIGNALWGGAVQWLSYRKLEGIGIASLLALIFLTH